MSSTEFDFYMAYKEENIIEILNTLELDGYIRIPRNAKKVEQIKKALEEERNLDLSDHLGRFQIKIIFILTSTLTQEIGLSNWSG